MNRFVYKKRLGQNFLTDKNIAQQIITSAIISTDDMVLEIGPGLGALTLLLAKTARHVVAVEKDEHAARLLQEKLIKNKITNVEIVVCDILQFFTDASHVIFTQPYRVVANIPYYLTSVLIRALLEHMQKPERIVLTIQKEVAQRICAQDGKESILSLSVKFYAHAKVLFYISKNSFFPIPKVDSALIEIIPKQIKPTISPQIFFTIMKAGFTSPRKKLITNLSIGLQKNKGDLEQVFHILHVDIAIRAQKVTLEQWLILASKI